MIAAINGAAVGVGVTMTLPMDVRICSEKAKFGFVFAKRGIVPEACSSWFLPKIVGISNALQWCLSGKIFMPQEALDKGLVTEVTPEDKLLERAEEIAADFVEATSSLSVTLIRQMLWKMLGADHPMEAHKIDSRGVYSLGKTGEATAQEEGGETESDRKENDRKENDRCKKEAGCEEDGPRIQEIHGEQIHRDPSNQRG